MQHLRPSDASPRFQQTLIALMLLAAALSPSALAQDDGPNDPWQAPAEVVLLPVRDKAIEQIVSSTRSEDHFVRANAMEAAQYLPRRAVPMVQLGLTDDRAVVRFVALTTMGERRLKRLVPVADGLKHDPSASVRAARLYALRRCGVKVDLTPIGKMLASEDPQTRSNAVMLLGRLGEESAIPMIQQHAQQSMPRVSAPREAIVRLQFAEAMARLGDDDALSSIRAGIFSRFGEVRVLAITIVGQIQDQRMEGLLFRLLANEDEPTEVHLAAARAISNYRSPAVILDLLRASPLVWNAASTGDALLRTQAVMTLGDIEAAREAIRGNLLSSDPQPIRQQFHDRRGCEALVKRLGDDNEKVRVAAAAAVLRVLEVAGLNEPTAPPKPTPPEPASEADGEPAAESSLPASSEAETTAAEDAAAADDSGESLPPLDLDPPE